MVFFYFCCFSFCCAGWLLEDWLSEDAEDIWGAGLVLLGRSRERGPGTVAEGVISCCFSWMNTSIMIEGTIHRRVLSVLETILHKKQALCSGSCVPVGRVKYVHLYWTMLFSLLLPFRCACCWGKERECIKINTFILWFLIYVSHSSLLPAFKYLGLEPEVFCQINFLQRPARPSLITFWLCASCMLTQITHTGNTSLVPHASSFRTISILLKNALSRAAQDSRQSNTSVI